jgi:NTE family protein
VLYADGWAPEEIIEIISSKKIRNYVHLFIPNSGFISMSGFEKLLKQYLRAKVFEELKLPLKVYAVNINSGEYTCFEKGPIISAIVASSSIPILFPPVEIDGDHYVDGGLLNNFPVEPLYGNCRRIIGVNVNPISEIKKPRSIRKLTERTLQLNIWGHTVERRKLCDLYIEPQGLTAYSMANLSSAKACFKLGYEATQHALMSYEL